MASRKSAGRTPAVRSSPTAQATTRAARQRAGSRAGSGAAAAASRDVRSGRAPANRTRPAAGAGATSGRQVTEASDASSRSVRTRLQQLGLVPLAALVLSLYGLGASIYLTIAHYDTHISLVCSDHGLINCEEVTTSSQSMVFGIFPVAVLGLAFYLFMVAANTPWAWRLKWPAVRWARLGSVIVGMGFVLYLIYAEVDQIRAICLWCTSVHVVTFLLFVLLVFHAIFTWGRPLENARS